MRDRVYKVHRKCVVCKLSPVKSLSLNEHHINWRRFGFPGSGKTMTVCSKHHKKIHTWIEKKAVETCLSFDRDFFNKSTSEYLELVSEESK